MSARRCLAALAVGAGALLAAAPAARAQGNEARAARADRLFREGKVALEAGRFEEACPKLAESQRLDPGAGTLLALALCDEGRGHTASAWREFGQVADESEKANRADRVNLARSHQRALEGRLSRLEVDVAGDASGVTVRVDGQDLPSSEWGTPQPVDPGDHAVEATAPAAPPWKTTVQVGADHDSKVVSVPALAPAAAPAAAPAPPPAEHPDLEGGASGGDGARTAGWILGGVGLAAIGAGSVFGVLALGAHGDATKLCPSSPCADPTGVDDENRAKTYAWIADAGIGLGVAAVAVGAYLVFLRPHGGPEPAPAAANIAPTVGPHGGGLAVRATW